MADSLRDLVVSLSLKTENFTRNINSVNKQIREAESTFKLAGAGLKGFENTAEGMSAKLTMLQQKLQLQKNVVDQYERALAQAKDKLTENVTRHNQYSQRLEMAKQRQAALARAVMDANNTYLRYKSTLGDNNTTTMAAKNYMQALEQQYVNATNGDTLTFCLKDGRNERRTWVKPVRSDCKKCVKERISHA